MGKLLDYAEKDRINRAIAKETERLALEGLSYQAALRKAKEMYLGKED